MSARRRRLKSSRFRLKQLAKRESKFRHKTKTKTNYSVAISAVFVADADKYVFQKKEDALKAFKSNKDARMKSFKSHNEALKFAKNGSNTSTSSSTLLESLIKCE